MDTLSGLPAEFETVLPPYSTYQPFRLFDLPDELWLHILRLSLVRPYPIDPTWARANNEQALIVAQPAILRTCRILRAEGLPLFYSLNKFESQQLDKMACTRDWLVAIGDAGRKAMRTFHFHCEGDADFWIEKFRLCGIEVSIECLDLDDRARINMERREGAACGFVTLAVTFL